MLKKKVPGLWLIILLLLFASCNHSTNPKFAVAANLLFPMQEIQRAYEAEMGKSFDLISGSSGVLSAQIQNGAPFDLFFSANMKYLETLHQKKLTKQAPRILVKGRSVFWSKYPLNSSTIFQHFLSGKINTLAIANPTLAPYGEEAKSWLEAYAFWNAWEKRLIIGENIGQVNQYIRLGSVDAAFTATSAMYAQQLKDVGYWYELGEEPKEAIPHGICLLATASKEAETILQFLQTEKAQKVFRKYGYLSP